MISEQQLEAVSAWLAGNGEAPTMEQELRAVFPGLHFTFCSDDDVMASNPAMELGMFNLYFVDSSSHCLCLTTDREAATGLVIAEVEDE